MLTAVVAHRSEVRKQTCDLITLMEMGAATSQYYMFMEDDFRVCAPAAFAPFFLVMLARARARFTLNSSPGGEAGTVGRCNHFVRASHYIIDKANREHPNWLAIRVSYGMNGIIMRSADLNLLSKYLRDGTARLPPDLLWQVLPAQLPAEHFCAVPLELRCDATKYFTSPPAGAVPARPNP